MYKLTIKQKNLLLGVKYDDCQYFNPVQDINSRWFVSAEEVRDTTNADFLWVKDLTLGDYQIDNN